MKDKLRSLLNKLSKLALLPEYLKVTWQQFSRRLPPNDRNIVFTLDDPRLYRDDDGSGRYAYMILNLFSDGGYNVYLHKKIDFLTFTRMGKYGRFLYSIGNLKVVDHIPKNPQDLDYAFDSVYREMLDRPWKKLTYVNVLKAPTCKLGRSMPIPYFFHPMMYKLKQLDRVEGLRESARKLRIIFGGNTLTYYTNPELHRYDQMTRIEGIMAASEVGEKVRTIQDVSELYAIMNGQEYVNECRLLRTDDRIQVPLTHWLEIVAQCDFFLCLSGTDLPMCHNVIESMSVGTIPILGYPDWFFPTLEHGKNAIIYSGKKDLIRKLNEVLEMEESQIQALRKNVLAYYDAHLGTRNFIRKYEAQKSLNSIILHERLRANKYELEEGNRTLAQLMFYFGEGIEDARSEEEKAYLRELIAKWVPVEKPPSRSSRKGTRKSVDEYLRDRSRK